jgi:LmbE family N-acetylglucosaminyl deacetylase
MKVLVIAPHMDDEVLGCGGTIVRHVDSGDHVTVCVVANRAYDHKYEPKLIEQEKNSCKKAKEILSYQDLILLDLPDEQLDRSQINIIIPLEEVVTACKPDIVYIPHRGDLNQDHRAVFEATRVVCRPNAEHRVTTLRAFEVPSSTDQVPGTNEWPFLPSYYVNVKDSLERKMEAMACYSTESKPFPHPRSTEGLRVYAQKRGMEVGIKAAEAFVILRDGWW